MKYGNPIPTMSESDIARFWEKVDKGAGDACWLWTAAKIRGYGSFGLSRVTVVAHRVSWVLAYGREPQGEVLDHVCGNRACVRPDHLEEVTNAENTLRGALGYAGRELCRAGLHDIHDAENVLERAEGHRQCKPCSDIAAKRRATCGDCGKEMLAKNLPNHRRRFHAPWIALEGETP